MDLENQNDLDNAASIPQPTEASINEAIADEAIAPATSTEATSAEAAPAEATATEEVNPDIIPMPEDAPRGRPRDRERNKRRPQQRTRREFKRYVTILWSGQREPVDDMYICDIEKNGSWLTVVNLEQVRTRREVLEYLKELDGGLIGLDFPFSLPQPFIDFVKPEVKADDWRALIKRVREDLKKNLDDGVRLWIERIGRYRESQLVPEEEERNLRFNRPDPRRRGNRGMEPLAAYERRSMAERFRRTEHNIRRPAEGHLTSSLQIGYNRLTSRYEFGDARQRGRAALLGMAMLDQLLEANENVRVWPWSSAEGFAVVEIQPWLFTRGKVIDPAECRKILTIEEDNGLEIEGHYKDLACRNAHAQQALMTTLGMIKAEGRIERTIRPLRDYPKEFYSDSRVLTEGWFYGVGYKPEGAPKRGERPERPKGRRDRNENTRPERITEDAPKVEDSKEILADEHIPSDLDKAAVIPQPTEIVQAEETIETASNDLEQQAPQS